MNTKNLIFICLISMLSILNLNAQTIHLQLVHSYSLQAIEGVEVSSTKITKPLYTDASGHVQVPVHENDTLIFHKAMHHPVYIKVHMSNFDTTHVFAIKMVPSDKNETPLKSNFGSLSNFEYHFVHDNINTNSQVKLHVFEHYSSESIRKSIPSKGDGLHIYPKKYTKFKGQSQYLIKP